MDMESKIIALEAENRSLKQQLLNAYPRLKLSSPVSIFRTNTEKVHIEIAFLTLDNTSGMLVSHVASLLHVCSDSIKGAMHRNELPLIMSHLSNIEYLDELVRFTKRCNIIEFESINVLIKKTKSWKEWPLYEKFLTEPSDSLLTEIARLHSKENIDTYVYLFRSGQQFKIGMSRDVDSRLRSLKKASYKSDLEEVMRMGPYEEMLARALERRLLSEYCGKGNEWCDNLNISEFQQLAKTWINRQLRS